MSSEFSELDRVVLELAGRIAARHVGLDRPLASLYPSAFSEHALARLNAGEEEYGDRWRDLGAQRLVAEMLKEAADIGGWGALVLRSLCDADTQESREAIALVSRALALAAQAHLLLESAHELLRGDEVDPT